MIYLLLLPLFFVSIFVLYLLSKHDFVLMRKNISTNQIYDMVGISLIVGAFVSRVMFFLEIMSFNSIIGFFHLVRFPGFVPLGFFIGTLITLWFLLRNTKATIRVYDIFLLSFFPMFLATVIFNKIPYGIFINPIVVILLLFFWFRLIKSHNEFKMKDGVVSLFIMEIISIDVLVSDFFEKRYEIFHLSVVQMIAIVIILLGLLLFFSKRLQKIEK